MKNLRFVFIFFLVYSCETQYKKHEYQASQQKKKATVQFQNINRSNVQENVLEIGQSFLTKNAGGEYIGTPQELDFSNYSGALLSAYSKDTKKIYNIFYRVRNTNQWEEWKELKENLEVQSNTRRAFSPTYLTSNTSHIQFKSTKKTDHEVVFRIFRYKK